MQIETNDVTTKRKLSDDMETACVPVAKRRMSYYGLRGYVDDDVADNFYVCSAGEIGLALSLSRLLVPYF